MVQVFTRRKFVLQIDTGSNDTKRLLIFASDKGLNDVQTASSLAIDGIFKCFETF